MTSIDSSGYGIHAQAADAAQLRHNDDHCPACGTSLQGAPTSPVDQQAFGATHFSRVIAIYSQQRDVTVAWRCPDCNHEWSRE